MDLSANEKIVLKAIGDIEMTAAEASKATGLKAEAVTHAAYMLEEKGLASVRDEIVSEYVLTDEGRKYAKEGLPERIIFNALPDGGASLKELKSKFRLRPLTSPWDGLRQKGWAKFEGRKDGDTGHRAAKGGEVAGRVSSPHHKRG